ncbi:MAG: serine/threonine protein kinase [Proteobacteria bacterium]|nr:serine/threonine protein kinase [Pseudomonadota bacterium]
MIDKNREQCRGATVSTPFATLTPDLVLDAAAACGLEPDGRLFALNSYENRVYQVGAGARHWVLKFYRPQRWSDAQILEEHAFTAQLAAAELPVAAPHAGEQGVSLLRHAGFRFAAFPWLAGRPPELDAGESRQILGRALARLHQVGATGSFRVRPRLSVQRQGHEARSQVLASPLLPEALRDQYARVSATLLTRIEAAFAATRDYSEIRIHGDCHLGNLLWNEHGPVFVDLDDCMTGPRIQDLWMLLSGSQQEQRRQWTEILEGYGQFADFDWREVSLIEPLRALRMLHHAAWVAHRWCDPAFPRAFSWFAEPRWWENYLNDLREQQANIEQPPLLG